MELEETAELVIEKLKRKYHDIIHFLDLIYSILSEELFT